MEGGHGRTRGGQRTAPAVVWEGGGGEAVPLPRCTRRRGGQVGLGRPVPPVAVPLALTGRPLPEPQAHPCQRKRYGHSRAGSSAAAAAARPQPAHHQSTTTTTTNTTTAGITALHQPRREGARHHPALKTRAVWGGNKVLWRVGRPAGRRSPRRRRALWRRRRVTRPRMAAAQRVGGRRRGAPSSGCRVGAWHAKAGRRARRCGRREGGGGEQDVLRGAHHWKCKTRPFQRAAAGAGWASPLQLVAAASGPCLGRSSATGNESGSTPNSDSRSR